jgi:hypothetical protein
VERWGGGEVGGVEGEEGEEEGRWRERERERREERGERREEWGVMRAPCHTLSAFVSPATHGMLRASKGWARVNELPEEGGPSTACIPSLIISVASRHISAWLVHSYCVTWKTTSPLKVWFAVYSAALMALDPPYAPAIRAIFAVGIMWGAVSLGRRFEPSAQVILVKSTGDEPADRISPIHKDPDAK